MSVYSSRISRTELKRLACQLRLARRRCLSMSSRPLRISRTQRLRGRMASISEVKASGRNMSTIPPATEVSAENEQHGGIRESSIIFEPRVNEEFDSKLKLREGLLRASKEKDIEAYEAVGIVLLEMRSLNLKDYEVVIKSAVQAGFFEFVDQVVRKSNLPPVVELACKLAGADSASMDFMLKLLVHEDIWKMIEEWGTAAFREIPHHTVLREAVNLLDPRVEKDKYVDGRFRAKAFHLARSMERKGIHPEKIVIRAFILWSRMQEISESYEDILDTFGYSEEYDLLEMDEPLLDQYACLGCTNEYWEIFKLIRDSPGLIEDLNTKGLHESKQGTITESQLFIFTKDALAFNDFKTIEPHILWMVKEGYKRGKLWLRKLFQKYSDVAHTGKLKSMLNLLGTSARTKDYALYVEAAEKNGDKLRFLEIAVMAKRNNVHISGKLADRIITSANTVEELKIIVNNIFHDIANNHMNERTVKITILRLLELKAPSEVIHSFIEFIMKRGYSRRSLFSLMNNQDKNLREKVHLAFEKAENKGQRDDRNGILISTVKSLLRKNDVKKIFEHVQEVVNHVTDGHYHASEAQEKEMILSAYHSVLSACMMENRPDAGLVVGTEVLAQYDLSDAFPIANKIVEAVFTCMDRYSKIQPRHVLSLVKAVRNKKAPISGLTYRICFGALWRLGSYRDMSDLYLEVYKDESFQPFKDDVTKNPLEYGKELFCLYVFTFFVKSKLRNDRTRIIRMSLEDTFQNITIQSLYSFLCFLKPFNMTMRWIPYMFEYMKPEPPNLFLSMRPKYKIVHAIHLTQVRGYTIWAARTDAGVLKLQETMAHLKENPWDKRGGVKHFFPLMHLWHQFDLDSTCKIYFEDYNRNSVDLKAREKSLGEIIQKINSADVKFLSSLDPEHLGFPSEELFTMCMLAMLHSERVDLFLRCTAILQCMAIQKLPKSNSLKLDFSKIVPFCTFERALYSCGLYSQIFKNSKWKHDIGNKKDLYDYVKLNSLVQELLYEYVGVKMEDYWIKTFTSFIKRGKTPSFVPLVDDIDKMEILAHANELSHRGLRISTAFDYWMAERTAFALYIISIGKNLEVDKDQVSDFLVAILKSLVSAPFNVEMIMYVLPRFNNLLRYTKPEKSLWLKMTHLMKDLGSKALYMIEKEEPEDKVVNNTFKEWLEQLKKDHESIINDEIDFGTIQFSEIKELRRYLIDYSLKLPADIFRSSSVRCAFENMWKGLNREDTMDTRQ
mmetsp:Transcript_3704/g.5510  ORF Transcript_3704/g.5510 Transcript_3704/m.5510 type:complete len:1238 (+) Transcript_3704:55-3768(+)